MPTNADTRESVIASMQAVLDKLYEFITPGTPVEHKTTTLAEELGLSPALADDRCVELMELGILTRTVNYGRYLPDGAYKIGRFAMWDLHMTKAEAQAKFDRWVEEFRTGKRFLIGTEKAAKRVKAGKRLAAIPDLNKTVVEEAKVVVATSDAEDTKAIAGPEAESPFARLAPLRKVDDAAALIAAARQYANRSDKVSEHITALKATAKSLGIEIDEAVFAAGIKLPHDERLETVALMLPYIDTIENKNARLVTQVADLRAKGAASDQLALENRKLRERVERLVSDRVITQQRAQA